MLVRCLYASRAASPLAASTIEDILDKSRTKNPASGITGILCYCGDIFTQVLEGGRDEVSELYNAIARDPRHTNVRLLGFAEIGERKFCNWAMGNVDLSKINTGVLLKYSEKPVLDPFNCSGHATMALLDELVDSGAISCRVS